MLNLEFFTEFFKANLRIKLNILQLFGKKTNCNNKFAYLWQNRGHALKRGNGMHGNGKKTSKMKTRKPKKIIKNEKKL
jgi:hypothetical protein